MHSPEVCCTIINACVVLHNILIDEKYPLPNDDEINYVIRNELRVQATDNNIEYDPANVRQIGIEVRNRLIREYFWKTIFLLQNKTTLIKKICILLFWHFLLR